MRLILIVVFILFAKLAHAHSWYEAGCCSDQDCHPVEEGTIREKADGVHVQGYGILSKTDPRIRHSRDSQDHMCISQDASHKLLCLYLSRLF